METNYKSVEAFKATHTITKTEFQDNSVVLYANNGDSITASIPYANGFCLHPVKCAGLHSCPRSYACSE